MPKKFYIFSTLTCDHAYTFYEQGGGDMPVQTGFVTIRGGVNITNKNIITPLGAVTTVNDDVYALLKEHPLFQLHQKNGFITVRNNSADPEKVAGDMVGRDKSAPWTPQDWENSKDPSMQNASVPQGYGLLKRIGASE